MEWFLPWLALMVIAIVSGVLFKLWATSKDFRDGFNFVCLMVGWFVVVLSSGKAIGAFLYWLYKVGLNAP